jgi:hypothetical protein
MTNTIKTSIIRDVTLNYAFLDTPHAPFGGDPVFDIQVVVPKKRRKELEAFGKVREVEGGVAINIKRYAKDAKGKAVKIDVVTSTKEDFRAEYGSASCIGNGSKGAIKVFTYPRGEQTIARLSAVQVTELKKYEPTTIDFDSVKTDAVEEDF